MSTFTKKDWVCLVDDAQLQRAAAGAHVFRQIVITADADTIEVDLSNVDRSTAARGVCSSCSGSRTIELFWDGLNDLDGISRVFEHEQLIVFRRIAEMLTSLRAHMAPLRTVLAA